MVKLQKLVAKNLQNFASELRFMLGVTGGFQKGISGVRGHERFLKRYNT